MYWDVPGFRLWCESIYSWGLFSSISTSELFHFLEDLVFIFCGKASWILLLGRDSCAIRHRCIWKLINILQCKAIDDILYIVKMLLYALLHRFVIWRHLTAWDFVSASFFLCTYWTICWEEGSLAAVPFLVQKCPWCQFWKVEDSYQMLNTLLSISRKMQQLNKCLFFSFLCAIEDLCHFLSRTPRLAHGGPSQDLKRCYRH